MSIAAAYWAERRRRPRGFGNEERSLCISMAVSPFGIKRNPFQVPKSIKSWQIGSRVGCSVRTTAIERYVAKGWVDGAFHDGRTSHHLNPKKK